MVIKIERKEEDKETDGEEETVAVMQSVKGATDDDGLVGVGRRERRKHHEHRVMLILNLHSVRSNCFRSKLEKGVVLGRCQMGITFLTSS